MSSGAPRWPDHASKPTIDPPNRPVIPKPGEAIPLSELTERPDRLADELTQAYSASGDSVAGNTEQQPVVVGCMWRIAAPTYSSAGFHTVPIAGLGEVRCERCLLSTMSPGQPMLAVEAPQVAAPGLNTVAPLGLVGVSTVRAEGVRRRFPISYRFRYRLLRRNNYGICHEPRCTLVRRQLRGARTR